MTERYDLTNHSEEQYHGHFFDGDDLTGPASIDIALHTGDPGDDGNANEVQAADYSRITTALTDWESSGNQPRTSTNVEDFQSDEAESNWGTLTHFTLRADDGTAFYVGRFEDETGEPVTETINEGEVVEILAGEIDAVLG